MVLDGLGNGYRFSVIGNMNRGVEDRVRKDITGAFGVPGEHENGKSG